MSRATIMVKKLAFRYDLDGYDYPLVAAAAVACRGLTGLEQRIFADHAGLDVAEVLSFELGHRTAPEFLAAYQAVAVPDVFDLLTLELGR